MFFTPAAAAFSWIAAPESLSRFTIASTPMPSAII